jgi:hypothetical protein
MDQLINAALKSCMFIQVQALDKPLCPYNEGNAQQLWSYAK